MIRLKYLNYIFIWNTLQQDNKFDWNPEKIKIHLIWYLKQL